MTERLHFHFHALETSLHFHALETSLHFHFHALETSLHFHALEKETATHSSVLAWRIPGTGKPGGLPSMESHKVRHN